MANRPNKSIREKALIVCSESPYPFVVGGYERLIKDYQSHVFSDYDVYFLYCHRDAAEQLFHYGLPVRSKAPRERILAGGLSFASAVPSDFDCDAPCFSPLIYRLP